MEKNRIRYLLEQQLAGKSTESELQELSELLANDANAGQFKTAMAELMQQQAPLSPGNEAAWQKMAEDIVGIDKSIVESPTITRRRSFQLYRWAAAASIIVLLGAVTYFMMPRNSPVQISPTLAITPVQQNTLSLPGGKEILLDDVKNGVIANLENITISKKNNQLIYTATGPVEQPGYHVLSTARSGNYEIVLADGSQVSLNASSSLRFPGVFSGAKRSVELAGESWFDVHHADRLPFSIHSGQFTTTVLGTAFDIKAYPGQESMTVSVQRGKVKVDAGNKTLATLLKGQQVKLIADSAVLVQRIDTLLVGAWKQGNLNYENEPLHSIVADLQRVFNDSISIQNKNIKDLRITARYHKNDGLQQILTMICSLSDSRLASKNGIFIIE